MTKYSVFLERVPSVNHIYGRSMFKVICKNCGNFVKWEQGGTYLKPEGKTFKEYAVLKLKSAIPLRGITGKLVVEVKAIWPDRRIRDINNLGKITLDAIQEAGIVANDKTCLWREIDFEYRKGISGLELTIYPLEVQDAATQTEAFPKPAKVPKVQTKKKAVRPRLLQTMSEQEGL